MMSIRKSFFPLMKYLLKPKVICVCRGGAASSTCGVDDFLRTFIISTCSKICGEINETWYSRHRARHVRLQMLRAGGRSLIKVTHHQLSTLSHEDEIAQMPIHAAVAAAGDLCLLPLVSNLSLGIFRAQFPGERDGEREQTEQIWGKYRPWRSKAF